MPSRLTDLRRAQKELGELGKGGWFAHDLQRGRALAAEVLGWLKNEGFKLAPIARAKIVRADQTDKPFDIMDAIAVAKTSVDQFLTPKGKKTKVDKTDATYLDNLGYDSACRYAPAILKQVEQANASGIKIKLPLPDRDINDLLTKTIEGLDKEGSLDWNKLPDTRRQIFVGSWFLTMQSKEIAK